MSRIKLVDKISYEQVAQAIKEWGKVYLLVKNKSGAPFFHRARVLTASGIALYRFVRMFRLNPRGEFIEPSCWRVPNATYSAQVWAMKRYDHARKHQIVGLYRTEKILRERVALSKLSKE